MSQTGAFVVFSIWYRFLARPDALVEALEPDHATTQYKMPHAVLRTGHEYRPMLQLVLMSPISISCNNT